MLKLLLAAGTVLFAAGHPALAQVDVTAMASMDGACRAEIEERPLACQPFGSLWEFGNGRLLFVFSVVGTLYSFSGSRLQPRGAKSFALIVDTVRIASQSAPDRDLTDAEGACVVRIAATGHAFTAIDCNAHSRGRNARYKFVLDHITNFERKALR